MKAPAPVLSEARFLRVVIALGLLLSISGGVRADTAEPQELFEEMGPPNLRWGVSPIDFTLKYKAARGRREETYQVTVFIIRESERQPFESVSSFPAGTYWDPEILTSTETKYLVGWWNDSDEKWEYVQEATPTSSVMQMSMPACPRSGRPFITILKDDDILPPNIAKDSFSPALTLLQNGEPPPSISLIENESSKDPRWLDCAVAWGRLDWLELLDSLPERQYHTIFEHSNALVAAGKTGQAKAVTALLERGFDPEQTDDYGFNAAHHAAINGHREVIEALLDSDDFDLRKRSSDGTFDLLNLALDFQQDQIVPLLVERGMRIRRLTQDRATRLLAFHAREGNEASVDYLLRERPDLNPGKKIGSLLSHAAFGGSAHIVSRLLKAGANPNPRFGPPPLSLACSRDEASIVQLLLQAGADPNRTGDEELPPLVFAVLNGDASIVKMLLEAGADPKMVDVSKSPAGLGTVEWATMLGNQEMVDALFAANAKCHFTPKRAEDVLLFAFGSDIAETAILAGESCLADGFRFYGDYSLGWVAQQFDSPSIIQWLNDSGWKDFDPPENLALMDAVTSKPKAVEIPIPPYGPEFQEDWGDRSIRVRIVIDEEGNARLPEFSGDPLPPKYQLNLFEAIKHWRFIPARVEENAVKTIATIPLHLKIPDDVMELARVSKPPKPISQPPPQYPTELLRNRIEGLVRVVFVVRENGSVSDPEVIFATHPALAIVATRAVEMWRFEPAEKDGRTIACRVNISIPFSIR